MKKILEKLELVVFIIVIIAILVLPSILRNKSDQDINNKLVMATEAGFAPYEFYENQNIVGVDVEIGREIAKAMGKELYVKDIAFDSLINELKTGKADFVAAGMSITEERLEEVDFTVEYATSRQVVVVRKDNNEIKNPEDIIGKKVVVQLGTVADTVLTSEYKDVEVLRQKKYLSGVEDVKAKKVDAMVMDYLPAKEIVKENSDLKILPRELFEDKYGMAVRKGNTELLNQINSVLERLMKEGKINEYIIKYSGK